MLYFYLCLLVWGCNISTYFDAEIQIIRNIPLIWHFLNFQEGLARTEKRKKWDHKDRQLALDNLEKFQEEARTARRRMWQYGDIQSDDEDTAPPARKAGGRR